MSRAPSLLWTRLPQYVRDADESRELAGFVTGLALAGLDWSCLWVDGNDPDTATNGVPLWADPVLCPRPLLGWLGLLSGLDTTGLPEVRVRDEIASSVSRRRGSLAALTADVRSTLTGSRYVSWTVHPAGDVWALDVAVRDSQCADVAVTEAAAVRNKPAGVVLTVTVIVGDTVTYDDVAVLYDTYDDVTATGLTYDELAALESA